VRRNAAHNRVVTGHKQAMCMGPVCGPQDLIEGVGRHRFSRVKGWVAYLALGGEHTAFPYGYRRHRPGLPWGRKTGSPDEARTWTAACRWFPWVEKAALESEGTSVGRTTSHQKYQEGETMMSERFREFVEGHWVPPFSERFREYVEGHWESAAAAAALTCCILLVTHI